MERLSTAKLKFYAGLRQEKHRREARIFKAEGTKLVHEALAAGWPLHAVAATDRYLQRHPLPTLPPDTALYLATEADMERLADHASPEGIVAWLPIPEAPAALPAPPTPVLLLHRLNDPGNLGTIVRSADWFGIQHLVCSPGTADCWNPKVVQASMGSIFRVQLHYRADFDQLVAAHAGSVAAAVLHGRPLAPGTLAGRPWLLLGSESHGLPPEITELPDILPVTIPRLGQAESLNAATAAAILLYAGRIGG